MSTSSILDTLDPPQPFYLDEAISRSTSPSAGWRPRSKSRAGSISDLSRPGSRISLGNGNTLDSQPASPVTPIETSSGKKSRRRSIFGGGRSRSKNGVQGIPRPSAWIAGDPEESQYDLNPLIRAEKVPELWDEGGDTYVYLFPRVSERGPSFRVRSSIFASSALLTELAYGKVPATDTARKPASKPHQTHSHNLGKTYLQTVQNTPRTGPDDTGSVYSSIDTSTFRPEIPPQQMTLYLPLALSTNDSNVTAHNQLSLTQDDLDKLIIVRNLFAFLVGGALIASTRRYTFLSIFLAIAQGLEDYNFTNVDSTSFGKVANSSFDCYVDELDLADVRSGCEKTIEGVVLGERMRSVLLYNEAFVHAVGRYDEIYRLSRDSAISKKFSLISRVTRLRMERAYIDLQQRVKTANTRLTDFDFPSLFISSKGKPFKDDFIATRQYVMDYYKTKYGQWPPRANRKKNDLRTDGLSRVVLREMYQDFTELYDLCVDRASFTSRALHQAMTEDEEEKPDEPIAQRLRAIFDEYDRSMPPVQPPIPFDVPLLPSLVPIQDYGKDSLKDTKLRSKRLKDDDVVTILKASRNTDIAPNLSPFLSAICRFERKEARGRNIGDIVNLRAGIWTFAYVVIQALPMLVIDAPGVRYHQGVEYFLCEPPRKGLPWALDAEGGGRGRQIMAWYGIAGGSGMVSLPSDLIEHGVEGIYRRSHCWLMAQQWSANLGMESPDIAKSLPVRPQVLTQNLGDHHLDPNGINDVIPPAPPVIHDMVDSSPASVKANGSATLTTPISSPYGSSPSVAARSTDSDQRPRSPSNRTRKQAMRESVIGPGLAELSLPHNAVSPTAYAGPRRPGLASQRQSSTTTTLPAGNTGITFDDIIASIDKDKKMKRMEKEKKSS